MSIHGIALFDEIVEHLEHQLDYYTHIHHKGKDNKVLLKQGSDILEGLVHEDPMVVAKALVAAKVFIQLFNSKELH